MNNLAPMENCPGMQGRLNWGYMFVKLICWLCKLKQISYFSCILSKLCT